MTLKDVRSILIGVGLLGIVMPVAASDIKFYRGHVDRIFVNAAGKVHFRLKDDTCKAKPPSGNTYWTFQLGQPAQDAWYSMLLTAALSDKQVLARFPSCNPEKSQQINYLVVDS